MSRTINGTPWHVERVHRSENDDRRYKGRCKFYKYDDDSCSKTLSRCMGSAHCSDYISLSEKDFKIKQKKAINKKTSHSDDDIYWY